MDENKYTITVIDTDELRRMEGKEGLIIPGCGGSLAEWITGINDILTNANILQNNTKFKNVYSFKNNGLTNLLFPFDDNVNINIGKLAMWRISTYEDFNGMWMTDYVDNYLDGFAEQNEHTEENTKPDCALIGEDGNIFNLMGIASRTLRQNGMSDKAKEMCDRIQNDAGDYYQALGIIGEYVNITSADEDLNGEMNFQ